MLVLRAQWTDFSRTAFFWKLLDGSQKFCIFWGPGQGPFELQTSEVDVTFLRYIVYIAIIRFFEVKDSDWYHPLLIWMSEIDTLNSRTFFDGINLIPLSWWAQISDRIEWYMPVAVRWNHLDLDW